MDEHLVLAFALAVALLSILPGPDMMFIVSNAAAGGRRAGVVAALGMSTALAVHTIAAALGLTALLAAAPGALEAVRWAGVAVLVYLAITTWPSPLGGTAVSRPARHRRRLSCCSGR